MSKSDSPSIVSIEEAVDRLLTLERLLHQTQNHPYYEYTTTTVHRNDDQRLPDGCGWMPNNQMFDGRNWERGDYEVTSYWFRKKEDAQYDHRSPFDLKPPPMPTLSRGKFIAELQERFPTSYMPSSVPGERYTSKPEYVQRAELIARLHYGTCCYMLEAPNYLTSGDAVIRPNVIYYGVELPTDPVQILVNLSDPEKEIWVRTKNLAGAWCTWVYWDRHNDLPINTYELIALLGTGI